MNLRALHLFLDLAGSKSIRQLSIRLDLSPTSVIRLIDQLEHYFQSCLFERSGGGIRLTEAGEILAERAPVIVASLQDARALIDDLRALDRGKVVIHAGGAILAEFLSPVVCDVHRRYPNLQFVIEVASASSITMAVMNGSADIGVTIFTPDIGRPLIRHSLPVQHMAFVSPNHPFATRSSVTLSQLVSEKLVLPDESFGMRRHFDAIARQRGLHIDPIFQSASLDVQKELAIRQVAVLVQPEFCFRRERDAGLLTTIPLSEDSSLISSIDVTVLPNRDLPFAARTFLSALAMRTDINGD